METAMKVQEELEKFREGLQQQRDELILQAGLAKLGAREEWEKAEAKLEQLMAKLELIGAEAKDASEDVLKSAKGLGEEIKTAYDRIRRLV
jgi:hypothetical protein